MISTLPFSELMAQMPSDTRSDRFKVNKGPYNAKMEFISHIDHKDIEESKRWKSAITLNSNQESAEITLTIFLEEMAKYQKDNCCVRWGCRISDNDGNILWEAK